eukprot:PhM_4_TR18592/c0_g1_i1/m.97005
MKTNSTSRKFSLISMGALVMATLLLLSALGQFRPETDVGEGSNMSPVRPSTVQTWDRAAPASVDDVQTIVTNPNHGSTTLSGGAGSSCVANKHCNVCLADPDCTWCASTATCVENSQAESCTDPEPLSCPAILLGDLPINVRVIHVAIRKGGPEALVQLHLALVHWGFRTTLDTRYSKKQKGGDVVPFFKKVYEKEFAKAPPLRWVKDFDDWMNSGDEGDVLLHTETWNCRNGMRYETKGVRQMQWHLTVWEKKDRRDCTIAAHTHFIAAEYMELPHLAVMFPYISPNIVALSKTQDWRPMKTNLVMYDSDTKMKASDFAPTDIDHELQIATGMTPDVLYSKYQKAKVGIDIAMPGAERFVYEASLFGVCIIADQALNGGDAEDLPIPERFRVPPKDLKTMNERKNECLRDYDNVIKEFEPLRQHVLAQRTNFYRHVRTYFSNNVHVVAMCCTQKQAAEDVIPFIMSVLFQMPFATIEIGLAPGVSIPAAAKADLLKHSYLAAVNMYTIQGHCPSTSELLTSRTHHTTPRRSKYVLWMDIGMRLVRPDLVPVLATQLSVQKSSNDDPSGSLVTTSALDYVFGVVETVGRYPEWLPKSTRTLYRPELNDVVFMQRHQELSPSVRDFFCKHPIWRRNAPNSPCSFS